MKASQIKGALLEFIVRKLLENCGFISVPPDDIYTFMRGNLFFVNGRGAAHDADVLMEPPIQMPFGYPSRLIFECKAYEGPVGLPIIRNALGLKYDVNEFEIVTKDSLNKRKNNRRATCAIEERQRHIYQVGVASIEGFTKPAEEFAANNKIPLLSLSMFLKPSSIDAFNAIDDQFINSVDKSILSKLYDYFKDRDTDADSKHIEARTFIRMVDELGQTFSDLDSAINSTYVGLLESGDLIFLFERNRNPLTIFQDYGYYTGLKARIHYNPSTPKTWHLSFLTDNFSSPSQHTPELEFSVPPRIMKIWKEFSLNRSDNTLSRIKAIDLKGEYFSKIFIFNKGTRLDMPFFVVNLDRSWLDQVHQAEMDFSAIKHDEDESEEKGPN
jgi:hypothetical protein